MGEKKTVFSLCMKFIDELSNINEANKYSKPTK